MRKNSKPSVFQIKVTLRDVRPPVWRRLLVASDIPLDHFHFVLQAAMGWTNSHLHQFSSGKTIYGRPSPEWDFEVKDEMAFTLAEVLRRPKQRILYEYDFGDSWEHDVTLEEVLPMRSDLVVPRCIAGARACPPEDCGGVGGYYNFVAAVTNPSHPEHAEMAEWYGASFNPEKFNVESINRKLYGPRTGGWRAV